jgi:alkylation response protein AidB-like acyl-CoA dehydrogenase
VPCVPGPLYVAARPQFSLHLASVGIGIQQHAVDDIIALACNQKRRVFAQATLPETPVFQHNLARAEISLRAARAVLRSQAQSFWAGVSAGKVPTPVERAQTAAWAATAAAAIVDTCYTAAAER